MEFDRLIAEHGAWFYLIAFVWTFLEGETIVVFAGFAAAQGLLNPFLLVRRPGSAALSATKAGSGSAAISGSKLLDRFPRWRAGVDAALRWLERYNTAFILSFRFIYGVRNFSSFAMGMSAVRGRRFLVLNFLAAALWAASFIARRLFSRPRLSRRARGHCAQVQPGDARRFCRDRDRGRACFTGSSAAASSG